MLSVLTRIAELNIRFNTITNYVPVIAKKFIIDDMISEDIAISSNNSKIEKYKAGLPENLQELGFCENLCVLDEFADKIIDYDAFLIHAAAIKIRKRGIVFTGKSGVGKTTHMQLWKKMFTDNCIEINGDKPVIRFIDNVPYVYGTPWQGIERIGVNERAPLTDICFIEQGEENSVYKTGYDEAFKRITGQIYIPEETGKQLHILSMLDKLLKKCNFWRICCNASPDAARIAYESIFRENQNEKNN